MRLFAGLFIVLTTFSIAFTATVNLSGTVKNGQGAAIAGVLVTLASDPSLKDTTDSNGAFAISNASAINGKEMHSRRIQQVNGIILKDNQLLFLTNSPAEAGVVSIYSGNGTRCAAFRLGRMEPGTHSHTLPALAAGSYVMRFSIDRLDAVAQLVTAGDGVFMSGKLSGSMTSHEFSSVIAAAAVDTLIASKGGFMTVKKEITSLDQKDIPIVMQPGSTLPPITDYSVKGPFATKVETNVGPNNGYTVFRPDPLGQNGFLHAPIVFGPGIGQTVQPVHTTMLTNFASHGFVVVGTPVLSQGPGGAQNLKTMQDGLDWIVKQNTTAGSIYQGKLWADHCVSMGFSVGGTSAVQMGGAAAVFTVVSIHGHAAVAALHGPMLQTTGTLDNVGMPLQQKTYDSSKVQTFLATLTGAAHQYIESNGGGEERKAIVAWMRYWIYNDTGAKNFFYGNDCVLCKSPWQNPQRKNWQ
jgi:hypothetical protein